MKHIHLISNYNDQKGSTLFEALIALVLTSIIALGGALSIGKIMHAHRQSNIQQIAVNQLRLLLQSGTSLCGTTPTITVNDKSLNVTVTCTNQATTVKGSNVTITKTVLSVTDNSLGGEVKVGE